MGTNFETARALARGWWELDVAEISLRRGFARCDVSPKHRVPIGGGCLANPIKEGTRTPELVCEDCYHRLPYGPWDGGKAGATASPYQTVDETLESVGKRRVRPVVLDRPIEEAHAQRNPPSRGALIRAFFACLVTGGAAGAITAAGLAGSAEIRPEAAKDGFLAGLACGLAAWLAGLLFRTVDIAARGRGSSIDRPDAAWRLTSLAAIVGAALASLAPTILRWLVGQPTFRETIVVYAERLARTAADPIAPVGIGVAVAAVLATLLPWGLANFRGLGRGMGAVDGLSRFGALLGAIVVSGLTAALLAIRPDLAWAKPGRAAPWVVYLAPVVGFFLGAWPRNVLVRGLAGATAGYAILGAGAAYWRPEFDPTPWLARTVNRFAGDPVSWSASTKLAFCLGLPTLGALIGSALSRTFLGILTGLLAATLAGCSAILTLSAILPSVARRALGILEYVVKDAPEVIGIQSVLLGAMVGLFAVAGVSLGFRRGMVVAVVGFGIAYGLAYLGFVVVEPRLGKNPNEMLLAATWRAWRWVGLPALALAPIWGYLLGRGRVSALVSGLIGYGLGILVAVGGAEYAGIDVASTLSRDLNLKPILWPALLAVGSIGAATGVIVALVTRAAGRRMARVRYVNKFGCAWCGRKATRDARAVTEGPVLPVCGDPVCLKELGRLMADPTARSLVDGPLKSVPMSEAPELSEAIQDKATPGRVEQLRRLVISYNPADA